jgi:anti-sigma regulatory factor (Ser/Thr protein kinase)
VSVPSGGSELRLSVPAQSDQISTLRSFAFAVGRQAGLDEETVEDLKLVLSEIAADGIEGGGSSVSVTVDERPAAIGFSVEVRGARAPRRDPNVDRAQLVLALFPTVRTELRDGGVITTFSLERG